MSGDERAGGARPDVAALLEEVDVAVAAGKASGFYDPVEVRRVEESAVALQADPDAESMERLLSYLREHWDAKACDVSSHRPGLAGRLVVGCKRLIHRLTRPYLNVALARQTEFNNQLVSLLGILGSQVTALRLRADQSEHHFDDVEARLAALERLLSAGGAQTEALLERLSRIVGEGPRAGEAVLAAASAGGAATRGAVLPAFEDLHRGTRDDVKRMQSVYLPHFRQSVGERAPLVDLGCGRGEFLELCREAGLPARGADADPALVASCRERGLEVVAADALTYLRALPDGALGGILLNQVVEHLGLEELTELVALCATKLAARGVLVAETVNPQSLCTFAGAFSADPTHTKPVHPEAARFLFRWAGLGDVQILYPAPPVPEQQLEALSPGAGAPDAAGAFNRNVARLNQLLYGPLDYAVVGRK